MLKSLATGYMFGAPPLRSTTGETISLGAMGVEVPRRCSFTKRKGGLSDRGDVYLQAVDTGMLCPNRIDFRVIAV